MTPEIVLRNVPDNHAKEIRRLIKKLGYINEGGGTVVRGGTSYIQEVHALKIEPKKYNA